MAMISLPFRPLMRIHYGRETGKKYTSFSLMRVSVIYFNFRGTIKLVVVEEMKTAILPGIHFNRAKYGG